MRRGSIGVATLIAWGPGCGNGPGINAAAPAGPLLLLLPPGVGTCTWRPGVDRVPGLKTGGAALATGEGRGCFTSSKAETNSPFFIVAHLPL